MQFAERVRNITWKEFQEQAEKFPEIKLFEAIDDDVLLKTDDIEYYAGVTKETVRNWARTGKIRVHAPVGKILINGDDFKEFMYERLKKLGLQLSQEKAKLARLKDSSQIMKSQKKVESIVKRLAYYYR
ncbi:helix-turn-helix domain-containing protein [Neobacillus vireti]|nr:helix-turn-helix domain-containing protein [Neobacillus vireti]